MKKILISILVVILLAIVAYVTIMYFREKATSGYEGVPGTNRVTELSTISSNKGGYQRISELIVESSVTLFVPGIPS